MGIKRSDIPKGEVMFMSYPNIQRMISGIDYAQQDRNGIITLVYQDGSRESRDATFKIEEKSCFEVTSFVQSARNL